MNNDVIYYMNLNSFKKSIIHADNMALKGVEQSRIKAYLRTTVNEYCRLTDFDIRPDRNEYSNRIKLDKDANGKEWIPCPKCGKHLFRVEKNTEFYNLPAYCKRCRNEYIINPK